MLGYTVFTALNGLDAIAVFKEKAVEVDLIIMDMIIPGINGHKLIKKLRKISPDIKIIISSGYSAQGDIQKILMNKYQGFIQKPYTMKDLAEIINKALNLPEFK